MVTLLYDVGIGASFCLGFLFAVGILYKKCNHKYTVIETIDKSYMHNGGRCYSRVYVSRCETCGKLKKSEIR